MQVWCKFGASLPQTCTGVVQVWCKFGASLPQTCTGVVQVLQVWCKFDASFLKLAQCKFDVNLHSCNKLASNLTSI